MIKIAEVTRSFDVSYAHGVMHVSFEHEVPVGLVSGMDCNEPKNMVAILERLRNCDNSKVNCAIEHDQDVLDGNPGLKEAAERGVFNLTYNIDDYIAMLKGDMALH